MKDSTQKVRINVILANRHYPMSVPAWRESSIRKAVREVERELKDLESKYDTRDKQDVLALYILQSAFKLKYEFEKKEKEEEECRTTIKNIIEKIKNNTKVIKTNHQQ